MGIGVEEILEAVVKKVPPPADTREEPLRALIFDSYYDAYRGVIVYFRVVDGSLAAGDVVKLMATGKEYCVDEVGVLVPEKVPCARLQAGDVGYLAASIKAVADARVGDTITLKKRQAGEALPGYQEATPMVFCGLFPTDADAFADLREALGRLQLNDAALRYEPEVSPAMGFGFRCGFLGWVVFLLQVFSFQVFFPPGVEVRERSKGKSERRRRKKRQGKTNSLSLSLKKKKKKLASCTWRSSRSGSSGSTTST
jgi:GTP-binding protein LepA